MLSSEHLPSTDIETNQWKKTMSIVYFFKKSTLIVIVTVIGLLSIHNRAHGQTIVQLPIATTGKQYGVTGWVSWGRQINSENQVWGYGLNLKYTPLRFWEHKKEAVRDSVITAKKATVQTQTIVDTITNPKALEEHPYNTSTYVTYDSTDSGEGYIYTMTTMTTKRLPDNKSIERRKEILTRKASKGSKTDDCMLDTIYSCKVKEYHRVRASLGVGYLSYFGVEIPSKVIKGDFDIAAPYAGIYINVEIIPNCLSGAIAYTSSFPSAEVVSTYTGSPIVYTVSQRVDSITNLPITYKIPTTPTHELGLGITLTVGKVSFFADWYYHYFFVPNIQHKAITGISGFPADSLQRNIGSDFDMSFKGVKGGFSLNF